MRVLGLSEWGRRAQRVVRDDPRFADILAVQQDNALHLYDALCPPKAPAWESYYGEWARVIHLSDDRFHLAHRALSGKWQELDVEGSLEHCVRAVLENKYHLFFG